MLTRHLETDTDSPRSNESQFSLYFCFISAFHFCFSSLPTSLRSSPFVHIVIPNIPPHWDKIHPPPQFTSQGRMTACQRKYYTYPLQNGRTSGDNDARNLPFCPPQN
eukprot:EG_transcript_29917